MYFERITELKKKRVKTQDLANPDYAAQVMRDSINSSDNFENLFEVPVLFFLAILTAYVLGLSDRIYFYLSTAFVALRVLHSVNHCTVNRVMLRFLSYAFSSLILWGMWFRLGAQIFLRLE